MKLTLILFMIGFLQVSAGLYSQSAKLTLEMRDAKVMDVLEEIEKQSEFLFAYSSKYIDLERKVSVQITEKSIEETLKDLFSGTNVVYVIDDRHILLFPKTLNMQQPRIITGTVTDENGDPVIGATVIVKGTTQGTITDAQGNFSITDVPEDGVLVFSFVGMRTQEVDVAGKISIDIIMEQEAIGLEEVVAIGYGSMRKRDLTGSVVKANLETFRESPNISIIQSLQGSVPGLSVGQVKSSGENPSIIIRGQNTIDGLNNTPLIVLDGIIFNGSLVSINPADIESVDVLKDASSTAIYGSRAANGVIIITTKKGESYGKPIFNYTGSYSIQTPAHDFEPLNRQEYIDRNRDIYWQQGYLAPDYTQPNPDFDPSTKWVHPRIIEGYFDGTDFNWWDAATQTGHIQNHNLSMRGKNEQTSYFISTGYTDQNGFVMNDVYKRFSIRLNVENKILDWFKIGVQSYVTQGDYSGATPNMRYIMYMSPLTTPYDEDGELVYYPMGGGAAWNPFFSSEAIDSDKRLDLFANFYSEIDIPYIKGLKYRFNYSHNYRLSDHNNSSKYSSNFTGGAYKYHTNSYDWTFDNIINYKKTINNNDIDITLVAGREEREYDNTKADGQIFANIDLGYNNLSVAENQYIYSEAWNESSLYYMGRLHYTFKQKYLATFTVRRDGFSGFSEKKKFGVFPSGAVAWVMSEEDFFKNSTSFIQYLKLRASYGTNGNRTLGRYGTLARVEASQRYVFGDGVTPSIGQGITTLANSDLTWETTTGVNLGVDFAILDQRIRGNIEYYNTNTKDILYDINIPTITGYSSITSNLGKVHNHGVEFSINSTNIRKKDITWDMGVNFSLNRNKIVSILGMDNDEDGKEDDLVSNALFIGKSLGAIYDYSILGLYQIGDDIPAGYLPGQHVKEDLNNDGLFTPEFDRKILGYKDPSYRISIINSIQFKNWSLNIFVNSVQGGKKWYFAQNDPTRNIGAADNITNNNAYKWDWWTPTNPNAEYQQLFQTAPIAPTVYKQRNFIRLQDVSLSYNFNNSILDQLGFRDFKVYISGKNLYTWTKWQGWDPETGEGYEKDGIPVLRSITFGVDLTF